MWLYSLYDYTIVLKSLVVVDLGELRSGWDRDVVSDWTLEYWMREKYTKLCMGATRHNVILLQAWF